MLPYLSYGSKKIHKMMQGPMNCRRILNMYKLQRRDPRSRRVMDGPLADAMCCVEYTIPGRIPHARGEDDGYTFTGRTAAETPPTRVGKTSPGQRSTRCYRKHPHARGEDAPCAKQALDAGETPPRAWGRRHGILYTFSGQRNTPTRVGKTSSTGRSSCPGRKHPHARGEDHNCGGLYGYKQETPPRAWGRLNLTIY